MTAEYRLFKRKSGKKKVYYARILDSAGNVVKTVSTGETNQYRAHEWIKSNIERLDPSRKDPTLAEYTKNFFVWGKCDYIERQNQKNRSIVESTARDRRGHLEYYLIPKWGEHKLREINAPDVEKWLLHLKSFKMKDKELSNNTKNQIIFTMNILFREAKREGIIQTVPQIEPFGNRRKKHRHPLTDMEINKLFPTNRTAFISVWEDFQTGVMFETILSTGARSGEARGWWRSDVMVDAKAIKIFRQLYDNEEYGLPGRQRNPDRDPRRIALLPDKTLSDIIELIGDPPYPDESLFQYDGKPYSRSYVLLRLKRAVKKSKIGRNIDVHTLRYTYTSKMRELMISADVPDHVLQSLLGHANQKMTDHYDPFMLERAIKKAIPSRPAIDEFWNTGEDRRTQ